MHTILKYCLIFNFTFHLYVCAKYKVATQFITVEGEDHVNGEIKYKKYLGIPYAKPPINNLRFQGPVLPDQNTKQKKNYNKCVQRSSTNSQNYEGNEDCLYLNVYTPHQDSKGMPYKVMVWIHGGNFDSGSGTTDFAPDYLVHEQVIVVTLNYRLGVFGFLSLQNEDIPGNMGLKDQLMALTWVQNNIGKFGGDPYYVTLFGSDAGAASIHFLLMSVQGKKLFSRAILQSGSAYSPWALQFNERQLAKKFLVNLKLATEDDNIKKHNKYNFSNLNTQKIYDAARSVITADDQKRQLNSVFVPVIENHLSKLYIINDTIEKEMLFKKKTIRWRPIIIGFNSEEGGTLFCNEQDLKPNWINTTLAQYLPRDLFYNIKMKLKGETLLKKIQDEYNIGYNYTYEEIYIKLKGDLWYTYPIYRTAVEMSELKDNFQVYFYRFSANIERGHNLCKAKKRATKISGADHGDEKQYLFKRLSKPEKFKSISKKVIKLWTQFAKFGNPTRNHGWYKYDGFDNLWKKIDNSYNPEYFDLIEFKMQTLEQSEFSSKILWSKVYKAIQHRKNKWNKKVKNQPKTKMQL